MKCEYIDMKRNRVIYIDDDLGLYCERELDGLDVENGVFND